jgi:GNAT superfamily N-acetyltransferase
MILVRSAGRQEVDKAAEVYLRSRHSAVPAIPPLVHDDDDVREWFRTTAMSEYELWLADDDQIGVVGIMMLAGDWLDQLYVDPPHAGSGVGSELLAVAKAVRPNGLQLWTFESNLGARRFYERHGFVMVERRDGSDNEERSPDVKYVWRPR